MEHYKTPQDIVLDVLGQSIIEDIKAPRIRFVFTLDDLHEHFSEILGISTDEAETVYKSWRHKYIDDII